MLDDLAAGRFDWVTFTSSSTAANFAKLVPDGGGGAKVKFASIGPITSQALRERGFAPDIEAEEYTSEGLVEAIVEYYADKKVNSNQ